MFVGIAENNCSQTDSEHLLESPFRATPIELLSAEQSHVDELLLLLVDLVGSTQHFESLNLVSLGEQAPTARTLIVFLKLPDGLERPLDARLYAATVELKRSQAHKQLRVLN